MSNLINWTLDSNGKSWNSRALVLRPRGMSGQTLLEFFQSLDPVDLKDLRLMEAAIEEGCERVDWSEW